MKNNAFNHTPPLNFCGGERVSSLLLLVYLFIYVLTLTVVHECFRFCEQ